jgi:DNA/RNA-binding domain of Phe-tRNA-synthetase-like protein
MADFQISVEPYPNLDVQGFVLEHSDANQNIEPCKWLSLDPEIVAASPFDFHQDTELYESTKSTVRDLLRHAGYKPTGRGKPASEYLVKAVSQGKLGRINPIVDTLNSVSLHSCLPISVVNLDSCVPFDNGELRIQPAPKNSEYVFNTSGQTMKLDGLLCLFDRLGPIANAVKDSQRTKTMELTSKSLVVIWGSNQIDGHTMRTNRWFQELVQTADLGKCLALDVVYN